MGKKIKSDPKNIYYNHGSMPIIIVHEWSPDPMGGPGIIKSQSIIMPGHGIDVTVVGLKKGKYGERNNK